MGVEVKPGAPPLASGSSIQRYAPTMEWAKVEKPVAGKGKVKQKA
jgi:hypothetical protein